METPIVRVAAVAAFLVCAWCDARAQETAARPQFEVASIKLNTSNDRYSRTNSDRGTLFIGNNTLFSLVQMAFGIPNFAITAPAWLPGERFDITAKFPEGTSPAERRLMMQALLTDRFHMVFHREKKAIPGFALIVAKNGPKIQPVKDNGDRNANTGGGRFIMEQMPMDDVARQLTGKLGQPVQNETGLAGVFTFSMTYNPDNGMSGKAEDSTIPSVFTALEEQLGLKLAARKIPFDVVVVDSIDKLPMAN
ncbi:MAG TPA: TIGR03435 family protein [Bryobacteraceae bacterium]|nr:TIGR03435 family protein [Bryobacteraceae bacterium]